jgi:hypothetical protein
VFQAFAPLCNNAILRIMADARWAASNTEWQGFALNNLKDNFFHLGMDWGSRR